MSNKKSISERLKDYKNEASEEKRAELRASITNDLLTVLKDESSKADEETRSKLDFVILQVEGHEAFLKCENEQAKRTKEWARNYKPDIDAVAADMDMTPEQFKEVEGYEHIMRNSWKWNR